MFTKINNRFYEATDFNCYPGKEVRLHLPDNPKLELPLQEMLHMYSDAGELLLSIDPSYYSTQKYTGDGLLVISQESVMPKVMNFKKPETIQDDLNAMMIDHEYRLIMLELGLNGEV